MSTLDAATTPSAVAADALAAARPVRRSWWRRGLRMGERFFACLGVVLASYLLCFDLSVMVSGSMAPTLCGDGKPGSDYVLTEKVTYWFRGPRRWETITFYSSDGVRVMKRVAGLPGELISMSREGQVFINGQPVQRPARLSTLRYYAYGKLSPGQTAEAGAGCFVLGDDSKDSQDSRWEKPVTRDAIVGRAWLVVWPLKRFGFVNP